MESLRWPSRLLPQIRHFRGVSSSMTSLMRTSSGRSRLACRPRANRSLAVHIRRDPRCSALSAGTFWRLRAVLPLDQLAPLQELEPLLRLLPLTTYARGNLDRRPDRRQQLRLARDIGGL